MTPLMHHALDFIAGEIASKGFAPSYTEMMPVLQQKSKSQINRIITQLEAQGYIRRRLGRARAIEIVRMPRDLEEKYPAVLSASSDRMRMGVALLKIAFEGHRLSTVMQPRLKPEDWNAIHGNGFSDIAYTALGGEWQDGKRLTSQDELRRLVMGEMQG
jgi:hypothetical protein